MTTPSVAVPVEDLAGKLKAIRDKFLMPTPDKDFTDYAVMTRCIDALSAAPAPEGGAVDDAIRTAQPVGWLRAVDEEMVCAHLGVADAEDSFETAKKKLASLIQWNIAVATDPSVGGHPAPDALREAVALLERWYATRSEMSGAGTVETETRQFIATLQAEQKGGAA